MRKSWKEHWRMTKYSDECTFADWPLFMNLMEVKEVNWIIDGIGLCAQLYVGIVLK